MNTPTPPATPAVPTTPIIPAPRMPVRPAAPAAATAPPAPVPPARPAAPAVRPAAPAAATTPAGPRPAPVLAPAPAMPAPEATPPQALPDPIQRTRTAGTNPSIVGSTTPRSNRWWLMGLIFIAILILIGCIVWGIFAGFGYISEQQVKLAALKLEREKVSVTKFVQPTQGQQFVQPSIESVHPARLGGTLIRHWAGSNNKYTILSVKVLEKSEFWITYQNGFGKECYMHYDATVHKDGRGRWEDGSSGETGSFTIHRSEANPAIWYGKMADNIEMTEHVDDISVELKVVR